MTSIELAEKRLRDLKVKFTKVLFSNSGRYNTGCRFCDQPGRHFVVGYQKPDGSPEYGILMCQDFSICNARRFRQAVQT